MRRGAWGVVLWASVAWCALATGPAGAFEFFDGRLQIHGYGEMQLRGIARNFDSKDDWDLTQMAYVLNLEIEADIAPDGWGPFDLITGFARVEVRYDCVWRRACGIFPSANAFGNDVDKLPKRLNDGRRLGQAGAVETFDKRYFRGESAEEFRWIYRNMPRGSRAPYQLPSVNGFQTFFTTEGPDELIGTADDPGPFFLERYVRQPGRCLFSSRYSRGGTNGRGFLTLGPIDPNCRPEPIAAIADKPSPFRAGDYNPLGLGPGKGALPYRPAPEVSHTATAPPWVARGPWVPNAGLADKLRRKQFADIPQFSVHRLEWNRGLHQDTWKELKELYLDFEMFDSRLWIRAGKQTVVWGKTELFRNQDQFNPQDLALASLPSLEESRTALWSVRGIWSFYEVGPLEDVRLEIAANFDKVLPGDFGQCGEPYAVYLICAGAFGQLAHGLTGTGFAGAKAIPGGYESWQGVEVGARVEWRWRRFSFALTDFYGYSDFPTIEKLYTYSRNVDPYSGRPRHTMTRGPCRGGGEAACLGPNGDALRRHSANQTAFAYACAGTLGVTDVDPLACGVNIFNSQELSTDTNAFAPRFMVFWAGLLSGQGAQGQGFSGAQYNEGLGGYNSHTLKALRKFKHINYHFPTGDTFGRRVPTPMVPLSVDKGDPGVIAPAGKFAPDLFNTVIHLPTALNPYTTPQQQALLGCGPYYRTVCDIDGIDLLNAEASFLFQSWPGFDGSTGDWDTRSGTQPGTTGFRGGPACSRYEGGKAFVLPGCRGKGDPGYDERVDGSTTGPAFFKSPFVLYKFGPRLHPFTGQKFRSEGAVLSWNFLMAMIGSSRGDQRTEDGVFPPVLASKDDKFDPNNSFRTDGCSFAKPQFCSSVMGLLSALSSTRNTLEAGGNGTFGRRDFAWHTGTPLWAVFDRQNVVGFSLDFAEDISKTNWSFEMTWIDNVRLGDSDTFSGLNEADVFNLTISVDRPTFINFLNANRTFFFNAQVFFRYIPSWESSISTPGPLNVLGVVTGQTGYFQDRLLAGATLVYDSHSNSGAFLPQVTYRFNESFSASVGIAIFVGRWNLHPMSVNPVFGGNQTGRFAYNDFQENGLSIIRHRDEAYLRIRYTY